MLVNQYFFIRHWIKKYFNTYDLIFQCCVLARHLINLCTVLKHTSIFLFSTCIDVNVCDFPGKTNRFTFCYILQSFRFNRRIFLYSQISELTMMFSLNKLYKSILWCEREIWDLFGIFFLNHHDLRRLLTDYGFKGHALRKDFPLTGYYELYYNEYFHYLLKVPVELMQEFRNFYFFKLWQKT
jgi:NADH:ubiquinone oxidoreductase subunit C